MRISVWLTFLTAAGAAAVVLIIGALLVQPDMPLITRAAFSESVITPNADGESDIALFEYSLSRNARVSLTFDDGQGSSFAFREDEPRGAGDYSVYFSGVVEGYRREGETIAGEVLHRLMPDGEYTWQLLAVGEDGASESRSGVLVLQAGDAQLPDLTAFSISPEVFTPNRDGISDRTLINVYLEKAAQLDVYLEGPDGVRIFVAPREEGRERGEAGRHIYDYEGGVDLGGDPPPDGTYTVVALAQDAVGQQVRRTGTLTIVNGGRPLAEIAPQAVGTDVVFTVMPYEERYFSTLDQLGALAPLPETADSLNQTAITMRAGDLLVFKLTVNNYGDVPLRTTGPMPGTVYQQDQRASALGWLEESGAWRVGIDCDTAASDYPWRWAIGSAEDLVAEADPATENTYFYLMPGENTVVWGAIRMTEVNDARNPQYCWAGLIHEDVEVANPRVGPREIELVEAATAQNEG